MNSNDNKPANLIYKFVERNLAISNSKFNVFYDHLISQDGEEIDDFIIIKPKIKNSENIAGICVIPFFNNKFFLMKFSIMFKNKNS